MKKRDVADIYLLAAEFMICEGVQSARAAVGYAAANWGNRHRHGTSDLIGLATDLYWETMIPLEYNRADWNGVTIESQVISLCLMAEWVKSDWGGIWINSRWTWHFSKWRHAGPTKIIKPTNMFGKFPVTYRNLDKLAA